jgi:lysophospholipase L1-like esterase
MKRPPAASLACGIGLALAAQLLVVGCGGGGGGKTTGSSADSPARTPSNFDFGANDPLRVTAFGDSITLGVLGDRPNGSTVTTSNNYPNNLQLSLRGLDPGWRVINRGLAGELAREGRGRLPGVLARDRPGFVLIMEGTNDANAGEDPAFIVASLEAMVDQAKANRSIPVLGTIPPNFRRPSFPQDIINTANGMIRSSARARGVVLAEIFNGMNDRSLFGSPELGIEDPLHPNERGYVRMASIWFAAMQQAIPAPPPPAAPPPPPPGGGAGDIGQRARRR